ncbi:MAG TPA: hypothetical protein VFK80_08395 [Limnochordia bacterium]|nr:hypothetical protein [Limnochordia bacterium]
MVQAHRLRGRAVKERIMNLRPGAAALAALFLMAAVPPALAADAPDAAPFLHARWDARSQALAGIALAQPAGPAALMAAAPDLAGAAGAFTLAHTPVLAGANYTFAGATTRAGAYTLGAGLLWFGTSDIPKTDSLGHVTGTFDYRQAAVLVGAGRELAGWDLGAVLKRVDVATAGETAGGWGLDLGVGRNQSWGRVDLILQDVTGTPIAWSTGHVDRTGLRAALGVRWDRTPWHWSGELDSAGVLKLGAERTLNRWWSLLGGFETSGAGQAITLGADFTTPGAEVSYGALIPLDGSYAGVRQTLGLTVRM